MMEWLSILVSSFFFIGGYAYFEEKIKESKKIKYKKRYKKASFKNFKRTVLLPFTYNELVKKFGKDVTIKKIIKKELFTVYKTF